MDVNSWFKIVSDLGFPIAAALAGGYFVFLTMKFILAGVMSNIKSLSGIITSLDNRVKTMNHDVIRIDTLISNALGVKPDLERIARADGRNDARKD
jgi:archaellum biogenesis ATPase FlaH